MTPRPDSRTKLLETIESRWREFQDVLTGLTDVELEEPGVVEDWSVRDIVAHVTIWEQEALQHLPLIVAGGRPPRYSTTHGGIDAFNDQMMRRVRDISVAEVLRASSESHAQLISYLATVPEEFLASGSRFYRRLRLDTFGHYPIHTGHVLDWRRR